MQQSGQGIEQLQIGPGVNAQPQLCEADQLCFTRVDHNQRRALFGRAFEIVADHRKGVVGVGTQDHNDVRFFKVAERI